MGIPSLAYIHEEVKKAAARGLLCSQIVIDIGLRELGMYSHDVVKAAGGLVGAMGFQGVTCGALTGAACLLTFAAVDKVDRGVYLLIEELETRFNKLIDKYPGNRCADILDHDPSKIPTEVCSPLIAGAIHIALELLETAGLTRQIKEEQDMETDLLLTGSRANLE
ncbi:MAG: C-GCAxxG-C-C family protein [Thermodesulfobacteriota bacterium]|nr:C-GCAxxG-C-C family protein [Thermodesulfobacteriota bacterium]